MATKATKQKEVPRDVSASGGRDLRTWLEAVEQLGELKILKGADWNLEIGAITELLHHKENSPAVVFDEIKGYPLGYRVVTNTLGSLRRLALTMNISPDYSKLEFVKALKQRMEKVSYIKPQTVKEGPVQENIFTGSDIDLLKFPTPKWHELDGGRYIGTGCINITRDPEEGWVNLGTYRLMIQNRNTVGFYISPGKQGRIQLEKYAAKGEVCKVAASVGQDPLLYLSGGIELPWGVSEYDWVGGILGAPVDVIESEYSGLPLPASAEIILEGDVELAVLMDEGPFGEWTGYYASSTRPEPTIKVKRLLHRNDPILLGAPPTRPPCEFNYMRCFMRSALIWEQLEKAGIRDVRGVWCHEAGGSRLFTVVSITQRYAGHARQAGMVAAYCHAGGYLGRYVVVVDDDIDVTNMNDVLWAMCTRSNPEHDIEIIRRSWSGPLDPIIPPGKKGLSSRAIIDACRPYEWRKEFPPVAESSPAVKKAAVEKWGHLLFD